MDPFHKWLASWLAPDPSDSGNSTSTDKDVGMVESMHSWAAGWLAPDYKEADLQPAGEVMAFSESGGVGDPTATFSANLESVQQQQFQQQQQQLQQQQQQIQQQAQQFQQQAQQAQQQVQQQFQQQQDLFDSRVQSATQSVQQQAGNGQQQVIQEAQSMLKQASSEDIGVPGIPLSTSFEPPQVPNIADNIVPQ